MNRASLSEERAARKALRKLPWLRSQVIAQLHIPEMENNKRPVGKETAKRLAAALNVDYRVFL